MNKIMMLAVAVGVVAASGVVAEEGAMPLSEGDAILISPDGAVYKSDTKVSSAHHEAALGQGATEVPSGTVFYKHEGKLYRVSCAGRYIGGWEQGYPGTGKFC